MAHQPSSIENQPAERPAHALLAPEAGCLSSGDSARGPNRRGSLTGRLMLGIGLSAAPAAIAVDNVIQAFGDSGSVAVAECLNGRWGTDPNGNTALLCDTPPNTGGGGGGGGEEPTWDDKIAEFCAETPNLEQEADELENLIQYDAYARFVDGSYRLVTYVRECNIIFVGEYMPELGRRLTSVELAIADPANEMTSNPPQQVKLEEFIAALVPADMAANPELYPVPTTTAAETTTSDPATTTSGGSINNPPPSDAPTTLASGKDSPDDSTDALLVILGAIAVAGGAALGLGLKSRKQHARGA